MLPHPVAHSIGLLLGDTPFCMRITTQVTSDMYMSWLCKNYMTIYNYWPPLSIDCNFEAQAILTLNSQDPISNSPY